MSDADDLLARSRRGDARATDDLFAALFARLLPLARTRISPRLSRRFGAEDVVQSVFCRFFTQRKPEWEQLDYAGLFLLLARMTVCRTLKQISYETADKRSPRRECEIDESALQSPPDAAALFADQLHHFLQQLLPPDREVLELRLAGWSTSEIAERLHTYDRKIRRSFERIRLVADHFGLAT